MIKDFISIINDGMGRGEISFNIAEQLLRQLSLVTGKEYSILNRRVIYYDGRQYRDAWVNA